MIDVDSLERRARLAAELGRLQVALRFAALATLPVCLLAVTSPQPKQCVCLGALVFALTVFFFWRSSSEGKAALVGVSAGAVGLAAMTLLRWLANWECRPHPILCTTVAGACLVIPIVLSTAFARRDARWVQQSQSASDLVIAGLLSGLCTSIAGVGADMAAVGVTIFGATIGATARLASRRMISR
jgi:hypothetical protein